MRCQRRRLFLGELEEKIRGEAGEVALDGLIEAGRRPFEQLARTDPAKARALAERIADKESRIMALGAVRSGSMRETDPVEVARASHNSRTTSDAFADAAKLGPEKLRATLEATTWRINARALVAEGVIRDPAAAWDAIPGELAGKTDTFLNAGSQSTAQMLARELSAEDRQRALATADRLPTEWRAAALEPLVAA